jgi:tetratricopeptide (TPR) repeat protein
MNGLRFSCGAIVFALAAAAGPLLRADDNLAEARRLYAAAQYEGALVALDRALPAGSGEADDYRVQCLLALGRPADAEQIVERIVSRNPLAPPNLEGRSPQFAATYHKVRQRILGWVAPTMYGLARASFDAGNLAVASAQFKELLALLEKNEGSTETVGDLRMLADGFSTLSRRRAEALEPIAPKPEAQAPSPAPAPEIPVAVDRPLTVELPVEETLVVSVSPDTELTALGESKPFAPWRPQVFAADDLDVTPPVSVNQQMPAWIAPAGYAKATFHGALEILVGEDGLVASVKTVERTHPLYDTMLVAAARQWRYEPALKDGRPVPYRKKLTFTLRGL